MTNWKNVGNRCAAQVGEVLEYKAKMSVSFKLKIKNFGSIRQGYLNPETDDFFSVSKCNVFIGNQGTGKSTIIKLISTFLWLEKALIRGDFTLETLNKSLFITKYLAYHCIDSYLENDTEIIFLTNAYSFKYQNQQFVVEKRQESVHYIKPKISYIPAERNFISALKNPTAVKGLPHNLFDLINDFYEASNALNKDWFDLPVAPFKYRYDSLTRKSFVSDKKESFENELYQTASGVQSVTPLALVTKHNAYSVLRNDVSNQTHQNYTFDELKKIQQDFQRKTVQLSSEVLQNQFYVYLNANNPWLYNFYISNSIIKNQQLQKFKESNSEKEAEILKVLEYGIDAVLDSCFINIVEEPEQNLFPRSQIEVVKFLVSCLNQKSHNALFMTTHSPFILNALNNYIYAEKISSKTIPNKLYVSAKQCTAYLLQDGKIIDIFDRDVGLIDTTIIDDCATLLNEQFDSLYQQEIEK